MVVAAPARPPGRLAIALADFAAFLPALIAAMACLRLAELGPAIIQEGLGALANDILAFLRYGPLLLVCSLPLLVPSSDRVRVALLGAGWTLFLCMHAALVAYFNKAGVPLGADLFAYSAAEIRTTLGGASAAGSVLPWTLLAAVVVLWAGLLIVWRRAAPRRGPREVIFWTVGCMLAALAFPAAYDPSDGKSASRAARSLNKSAFFVGDSVAYLSGRSLPAATVVADPAVDPRYPFLREERTPDTLGPRFSIDAARPPNIVLIVVEGLGRSFSGPGARLGSFTPFLDELSGRSLYFENFLAAQGRTFAVLPSILGSLPFGATGFSALADGMPAHASLPGVLKDQGYRLRYYTGSNLEFDQQGAFLRQAGITELVSQADFGPLYKPSSEWGFADRELVETALARERKLTAQPYFALIQTSSMHTPFLFPGKESWEKKVDERLAALGIPEDKRSGYREQREIYASVLYADDALRLYFTEMAKLPSHANTIYLITGDHRLPELAMDTRLERYHVPLIVYSPLLKSPASIKAVSSHFDIAPSLLSFLSHNYGIKTPPKVTWLGSGLDLEAGFRNLHTIPIKQTKTEMSDFISGTALLAQDKLFTITDGMQMEPSNNAEVHRQVREQFARFMAANASVRAGTVLAPAGAGQALAAYSGERRTLQVARLAAEAASIQVSGTAARIGPDRAVRVTATFANGGNALSPPVVPLLVVSDAGGKEVAEVYGKALTLGAGKQAKVELVLDRQLPPGQYFLSLLPSHPDTGKPAGAGQYRIPVTLPGAR